MISAAVVDPMQLKRLLWPSVRFTDYQRDIIYSVVDNDETVVVAGHGLGKDFVCGFIALWYFLAHPVVRIVTTSVKDDHLRVLWGEIGRFVDTAAYPLSHKQGGPLVLGHREIKKLTPGGGAGQVCKVSYLIGAVSEKGEGMAGHHAPHALLIVDEASGVDDEVIGRTDTWAKRRLLVGNPYPCNNHFFRAVKGGDIPAPAGMENDEPTR